VFLSQDSNCWIRDLVVVWIFYSLASKGRQKFKILSTVVNFELHPIRSMEENAVSEVTIGSSKQFAGTDKPDIIIQSLLRLSLSLSLSESLDLTENA
jgi:hypothetical protein